MKKLLLSFAVALLTSAAFAQPFFETTAYRGAFGQTNWLAGWTNFNPNVTIYPGDPGYNGTATSSDTIVSNITTNTTWVASKFYVLKGAIHVSAGATLTIEPGTVIKGITTVASPAYLLIAKGAKINAIGTVTQPIVFTSYQTPGNRNRGDWGGLLLIGKAHVNVAPAFARQFEALPNDPQAYYGGGFNADDNDNSGTLKYVRVEYAGWAYQPNQEINGVTFGAVGRGTTIDYVQATYTNDDSFEWFGGSVNCKHLVAFAGTDDEFDCDEGYNGNVQFALGVRHPKQWETNVTSGASNGFEHDNNTGLGTASQTTPGLNNPLPVTAPTFSNVTIIGPIKNNLTTSSLATGYLFRRGAELRTNTATGIYNSIIIGYPILLNFGHPSSSTLPSVQTKATSDSLQIHNTIFGGAGGGKRYVDNNSPIASTFNLKTWLTTPAYGNDTSFVNTANIGLVNPFYSGNASGANNQIDFSTTDFTLTASSPANTGASFAAPRLTSATTGVAGNITKNAFATVYPNPATNVANFSINLDNNTALATITLSDVSGRIIKTANYNLMAGTTPVTLNTAGVSPGVYIATVSAGAKVQTIKLVIE